MHKDCLTVWRGKKSQGSCLIFRVSTDDGPGALLKSTTCQLSCQMTHVCPSCHPEGMSLHYLPQRLLITIETCSYVPLVCVRACVCKEKQGKVVLQFTCLFMSLTYVDYLNE